MLASLNNKIFSLYFGRILNIMILIINFSFELFLLIVYSSVILYQKGFKRLLDLESEESRYSIFVSEIIQTDWPLIIAIESIHKLIFEFVHSFRQIVFLIMMTEA